MPKTLTQIFICVRAVGAANVRPVPYLRTYDIKNELKPGSIDSLIMMDNALIWSIITQRTKTNLQSTDASLKRETLITTKSTQGSVKMNAHKKNARRAGKPILAFTQHINPKGNPMDNPIAVNKTNQSMDSLKTNQWTAS